MHARWQGGCLWLLVALLGMLLFLSALAGAGIMIGLRQPGQLWVVPAGGGYFAIGRIVSNECKRLQARGFLVECPQVYGALLYVPRTHPGGNGVEYTLFAIPDPHAQP
jgi:hypothetical protein